jgi:hypothetical protein
MIVAAGFFAFAVAAQAGQTPRRETVRGASSCNVVVGGLAIVVDFTNESDSALTLKGVEGLEGEFLCAPPQTIAIGEGAAIISVPSDFLHGTEFTLVYELENHSEIRMNYDDPFIGDSSHHDHVPPGYSLDTSFDEEEEPVGFTVSFGHGCGCDGIPDEWKRKGVTIDPKTGKPVPKGTPGGEFIDLPHMGVSLDRPNVLVQMDWMKNTTHDQHFEQAAIDKVIEAYDKSPVTYPSLNGSGNGATRPGITLIVDNGEKSTITPKGKEWGLLSKATAVTWEQGFLTGTRTGGYDTTHFGELLKSDFTPTGRAPIFHYAIAAADISSTDLTDSTSGLTPNGYGFIASLGGWTNGVGSEVEQGGTFMHELGHVLGLQHGGEDGNSEAVSYKPNYPSVMDYFYDPYGVLRNSARVLDYSREPEPSLNEATLTETGGFAGFGTNPLGYGIEWKCPTAKHPTKTTYLLSEVDWNCDGTFEAGTGFDVDGDGSQSVIAGTAHSDWERINFRTGGVGTGAAAESEVTASGVVHEEEITAEIARSLRVTPLIHYSGARTGHYHDPFTASATLIDPGTEKGVKGASITFELGSSPSDSCTATTDASGTASCTIRPTRVAGPYNVVASFAGDSLYQPVSNTQSFTITPEETTTVYTGPTVILAGASGATLTAKMVEDGSSDSDGDGGSPAPIPSEPITLSLGAQSCSASTDASGNVSCTIPLVAVPLGPETAVASFAGDSYYSASGDSKIATVFAFPGRGAFVLGDKTASSAGNKTVTWWGGTWSGVNRLSGGLAPHAFKGFAAKISLPTTTPAAQCGSAWATTGGNSPRPTNGVPSYMGSIVTTGVTKSGRTISGNAVKIVVVKTNPGYAPNPGHHGTGRIVATYC